MKRYLTGSCLFFRHFEDFCPHDKDYCELHEDMNVMYKRDPEANWDVWQWKKASPEEYVEFALTEATPWQICQFLTPSFCKDTSFTIEHLKQLKPLADRLGKRHRYQKIIFDAFIENNGFWLSRQQLQEAYEEYKDKRKYDYFFNKD